jgi:hypothetical protein
LSIEHPRPVGVPKTADFPDLAVLDADVGLIAWHARSIDDYTPSNDSVELSHGDTSFGPVRP